MEGCQNLMGFERLRTDDIRPHTAPQEYDTSVPPGSSHLQPYVPLHDRVANLKTSSLDFAPHFGLPLSVRTSRKTTGNGCHNAADRPRSRCSTPQRLLNTPLHALNESSFIMDDGALDPLSARLWTNHDLAELSFIKQESPALHLIPCTSTLGSLMHGSTAFANIFSQHFGQHQQSHAIRPTLPNPQEVQKFLQTAAELQLRAQLLREAESFELDRAKRLKINQHHPQPQPRHISASTLLDSPDGLKVTGHGALSHMSHLLSSPNCMALMSCLQHDLSSPTCFAEVRLLDSKNNTPTRCVLGDFGR